MLSIADKYLDGAKPYWASRPMSITVYIWCAARGVLRRGPGRGAVRPGGVTPPSVTAIRYYYEESGPDAANLLLERIKNPDTPTKEIRLGYALVERESTGRGRGLKPL